MTDANPGGAPDAAPDGAGPITAGESFGHRAMSGAVLLALAQAVKLATQFGSVFLLSRLLSPVDFGVFAMVMPIVAFVMLIQDFGLSGAIVAAKTLDHAQETTLFWLNLAAASVLAVALVAAAPLIAHFYRSPAVLWPTVALAGSVFLSGLATLQFSLLVRNLKFGAMAVADIAGALAGLAIPVAIAWSHPSPWALIASVFANMIAGLACAWSVTRWLPGRPAPLARIKSLLAFGGGLSGATFAHFVARNADNVLIGRYLGAVPLGFYDRAYKLLLFPLQQVVSPLSRVVVPVLVRLSDEPGRYATAYRRALDLILIIAMPGMMVVLIMADTLIVFVMGPVWLPVVPIFRWLGLVGLTVPLSQTLPWLLMSQGRTRPLVHLAVFHMVCCVVAFGFGLRFGIVGMAACYALVEVVAVLPVAIWYTGRGGPVSRTDLLRIAGPHALACIAVGAVLWWLRPMMAGPPILVLPAAGLLGYAIAAGVIALFPSRRTLFTDGLQLLNRRRQTMPS